MNTLERGPDSDRLRLEVAMLVEDQLPELRRIFMEKLQTHLSQVLPNSEGIFFPTLSYVDYVVCNQQNGELACREITRIIRGELDPDGTFTHIDENGRLIVCYDELRSIIESSTEQEMVDPASEAEQDQPWLEDPR
jgi:hypothetical protein